MDRPLTGFIAIILIITTITSVIIFNVEDEEPVRLLSHRTPKNIPGRRPGSPSYSLDVMVTQDLPRILIKTHFLEKLENLQLAQPWNETEARSLEGLVENVPVLAALSAEMEVLSRRMNASTHEVIKTRAGGETKLYFIDFTDSMAIIAGESQLPTTRSIYAFQVDPQGSVSIYGGYRDFFFMREEVISEIRYQLPSQYLCFRSEDAPGGMDGCQPVLESPVGIIEVEDIHPDEKVHLEVTLNTQQMFGHKGIIQLVTVETGHGRFPIIADYIGPKAVS